VSHSSISIRFRFGRPDVAKGLGQPALAAPVAPTQRGVFDGFETAPLAASMNDLSLVQAVGRPGRGTVIAVTDAAAGGSVPASAGRSTHLAPKQRLGFTRSSGHVVAFGTLAVADGGARRLVADRACQPSAAIPTMLRIAGTLGCAAQRTHQPGNGALGDVEPFAAQLPPDLADATGTKISSNMRRTSGRSMSFRRVRSGCLDRLHPSDHMGMVAG